MAIFCTKCGTSNADHGVFCENCGTALRKPVASQRVPAGGPLPLLGGARKRIYAAVALGGLLLLGSGAAYFLLTPSAPTNSRLLAAAKLGHGDALLERSKRELCLSNMNYSLDKFNAAQYDSRTQNWLNTLVQAGLYGPGTEVTSGGVFSSPLVQYAATPELAKWRDGGRLCLVKGVEIADVVDIQKPQEKALGADSREFKLNTVEATLLLRAIDVAPWLDKADVQTELLGQLTGWEYQGGMLQKRMSEVFGLRDGKWATGPTYMAELEKQYAVTRRASQGNGASALTHGGWFAGLAKFFSFGGHPLQGTWQMNVQGLGPVGGAAESLGLGTTFTFTGNSMEVGGHSIKCNFEVDGKRVKVTPEGQSDSYIFEMRDNETAVVDLGVLELTYKRVR